MVIPARRCDSQTRAGFTKLADDTGAAALYFVVIATAVVFAAALVLDGGRKMSKLSEAVHLADNGARACAQAVDEQALLGASRHDAPVLNEDAARAATAQYFLQTGVGNYQVGFDATGSQCIVTVTLPVPAWTLPMGDVTATQSAGGQTG